MNPLRHAAVILCIYIYLYICNTVPCRPDLTRVSSGFPSTSLDENKKTKKIISKFSWFRLQRRVDGGRGFRIFLPIVNVQARTKESGIFFINSLRFFPLARSIYLHAMRAYR